MLGVKIVFKLLFKQKYSILVFIITVLCAAAQVATSYGFSLIIQATVDKNLRFMVSADYCGYVDICCFEYIRLFQSDIR